MDIFEAEMARRFVVAVEKIANALDRKDEPQTDCTTCDHWKERKDVAVNGCELLLTNQPCRYEPDCPWK